MRSAIKFEFIAKSFIERICFRGMSLHGGWHYGMLSHVRAGKYKGYYIDNESGMPLAYEIMPETIGQFTGFLDNDKNPIYAGDILLLKHCDGTDDMTVEVIDALDFGYAGFGYRNIENNKKYHMDTIYGNRLILGNRFEHPGLLTGDNLSPTE